MSDDSVARTPSAAPLSEDADYDAIHETIVATERGRWFLDEYVRRYRGADTEQVLAAIARIEQTLHSGSAAEPDETGLGEIAAMLATIEQARGDLASRGDLAASGEAAIADFRNAAEQIQQVILGTHGPDSDLGQQLSFQTNRLAGAGERLERSIAGLRPLLALLEDIEQRLYGLVSGAPPDAAELAPQPAASPQAEAPIEWSLPVAGATAEAAPEPEPPPLDDPARDDADPVPPRPDTGVFWDLTVVGPRTAQAEATEEAEFEASMTDWAFAAADTEPAPDTVRTLPLSDASDWPENSPVALPTAALEQLEAREYGRQPVATAVAPPAHGPSDAVIGAADSPEPPQSVGFDDLVLGGAPAVEAAGDPPPAAEQDDVPAAEPLPELGWTAEPTPAAATSEPSAAGWIGIGDAAPPEAGPMLDTDLFDGGGAAAMSEAPTTVTEDDGSAASPVVDEQADDHPHARLPPLPPWPDRGAETASGAPQPSAPDSGVDMPSVLQRLESMRTAIAALMDEVSEKTGRRPPPQS